LFKFKNPTPETGNETVWHPDALPITQSSGDLQITLRTFASGLGQQTSQRAVGNTGYVVVHQVAKTGREPGAYVQVDFESPRSTNETWAMFDAAVSDSTGNTVPAHSRSEMTTNMEFRPVLWSNATAWKLKLHLKRTAGFRPDELLVFSNVPVPTVGITNILNRTNTLNGFQFVLKSFVHRPDLTNHSWSSGDLSVIRLEHGNLGTSNVLDLVGITVQPAGTNLITQGSGWSDNYHEYNLKAVPANAMHLDLTYAFQPVRFVEFTVAPNWRTNDLELGAPR